MLEITVKYKETKADSEPQKINLQFVNFNLKKGNYFRLHKRN